MTGKLENRAAVVTGGGSGIGKCVSARLAADGAHVRVLDIDLDAAGQTVDEIAGAGGSVETMIFGTPTGSARMAAVTIAVLPDPPRPSTAPMSSRESR